MKFVRVYDFKAKVVSTIPEAELGAGMVQFPVPGVGKVFVMPSALFALRRGDVALRFNLKLPAGASGAERSIDIRETGKLIFVQAIADHLAEVRPYSLDQWVSYFERVPVPDLELAVWLILAKAFANYTQCKFLSLEQKQEALQVLVHLSISGSESAFWETVELCHLSKGQAQEAVTELMSALDEFKEPFEQLWNGFMGSGEEPLP